MTELFLNKPDKSNDSFLLKNKNNNGLKSVIFNKIKVFYFQKILIKLHFIEIWIKAIDAGSRASLLHFNSISQAQIFKTNKEKDFY